MAVKPVPDGFHTVTPYLVVKGANALVDFITRAFGAKEVHLMKGPRGEIRQRSGRRGRAADVGADLQVGRVYRETDLLSPRLWGLSSVKVAP